jgi:hypothetical protein
MNQLSFARSAPLQWALLTLHIGATNLRQLLISILNWPMCKQCSIPVSWAFT